MVDFDQASRREIIKALSGLGVSTASIQYLTEDVIAKTHDDEVPLLHSVRIKDSEKAYSTPEHTPPETEKVYQRMGWGEWARIQSRYEAESKIAAEIEKLSGTNGMVSTSVGTQGGNRGVTARLTTTLTGDGEVVNAPDISEEEVRKRLSREVDVTVTDGDREREFHDIPVWVKSEEMTLTHNCGSGAYRGEYRPVPGGCQAAYPNEYCTLGTPAYKFGVGRVMLGAAHCTFDYDGGEDPETHGEGSTALQPEYNVINPEIGEVIDVKSHFDSKWDYLVDGAVIDLNSSTSATNEIAGTSLTYDEQINGWIGYDALKTKETYGQSLYRQGRTSGRCSGVVEDVSTNFNYVEISGVVEGGDSGGPIFEKNGDKANIAATIFGYNSEENYTRGYAIEDFKNRFNIDTIP